MLVVTDRYYPMDSGTLSLLADAVNVVPASIISVYGSEPHDEAYIRGTPFLSWTLPVFIFKVTQNGTRK